MKEDTALPQINVSKIVVGGGLAGAFFVLAGMSIFLVGVPLIRYLFSVSVVLGLIVALVLHFTRHETSSTDRILTVSKK
jgi:hypothetical protein